MEKKIQDITHETGRKKQNDIPRKRITPLKTGLILTQRVAEYILEINPALLEDDVPIEDIFFIINGK